MKAEVITWSQLAEQPHEGRRVLLTDGLVTLLSVSEKIATFSSQPGVSHHRVTYKTPWGSRELITVRGEYLVAVIESGPDAKEQEKE